MEKNYAVYRQLLGMLDMGEVFDGNPLHSEVLKRMTAELRIINKDTGYKNPNESDFRTMTREERIEVLEELTRD